MFSIITTLNLIQKNRTFQDFSRLMPIHNVIRILIRTRVFFRLFESGLTGAECIKFCVKTVLSLQESLDNIAKKVFHRILHSQIIRLLDRSVKNLKNIFLRFLTELMNDY